MSELGTGYAEGKWPGDRAQKELKESSQELGNERGLLASRWCDVHVSGSEPCLPISRAPENSRADRPWRRLYQVIGSWEDSPKQGVLGLCYSDAVNKAKNWMEGHQRGLGTGVQSWPIH